MNQGDSEGAVEVARGSWTGRASGVEWKWDIGSGCRGDRRSV